MYRRNSKIEKGRAAVRCGRALFVLRLSGSEPGTDTESLYQGTVPFNIYIAQVGEQTLSASYQLHQATAGVMVLFVKPQVVGQLADARGQKRNLYFRRTRIAFFKLIIRDYGCSRFCWQRHGVVLSCSLVYLFFYSPRHLYPRVSTRPHDFRA